jgi:hypothetical protein
MRYRMLSSTPSDPRRLPRERSILPSRRMRTRMYGGVTGKTREGQPMSINKTPACGAYPISSPLLHSLYPRGGGSPAWSRCPRKPSPRSPRRCRTPPAPHLQGTAGTPSQRADLIIFSTPVSCDASILSYAPRGTGFSSAQGRTCLSHSGRRSPSGACNGEKQLAGNAHGSPEAVAASVIASSIYETIAQKSMVLAINRHSGATQGAATRRAPR